MGQTIRDLSDDMIKRLKAQRDWVRNHYDPDSVEKYKTIEGKLKLLDVIIKSKWISKDETLKLQCLGVTLGDIIVQDLDFTWIELEDEYGVDPAIKYKDTSLILFPLTMISKRIENDEDIDIYNLYQNLHSKVTELKESVD